MVGEVDHDSFGVHAERGGDELGIHGVDQVDQPGAAEHPGRDAARVEHAATDGAANAQAANAGSPRPAPPAPAGLEIADTSGMITTWTSPR